MDIGALGINFPRSAASRMPKKPWYRALSAAWRTALGSRSTPRFRWGVSMPYYLNMATAGAEMICMITSEHVEAVERIDEIMAVPGIDLGDRNPATTLQPHRQARPAMTPSAGALMAARRRPASSGASRSGVVARTAK